MRIVMIAYINRGDSHKPGFFEKHDKEV